MAAAPLQMASQPLGTLFSIRFLRQSGVRVAIITEQGSSGLNDVILKVLLAKELRT